MSETWKITATPRARFNLANLLLNPELKFKTREEDRALFRGRKALGLIGVSEMLIEHKGALSEDYQRDRTTRHVFEVTAERAEFFKKCREKVEMNAFSVLVLEDFFEQLEAKTDAPDVATALPFDEEEELPRWKPSKLPRFEGPEKFYDVLKGALATEDFAAFKAKLLPALDPPKEEAKNGATAPASATAAA